METAASHWSMGAPAGAWVPALLLAGLTLWLGWAQWQRRGRHPRVAAMEGLKALIVVLILFTLLQPERVRILSDTEPPELVVLEDDSDSMTTRDWVRAETVQARRDWVAEQRTNAAWATLGPQVRLRREVFGNGMGKSPGTDLDTALQAALQQHDRLKAVVLLSDGDWNTGASPVGVATRFRERDVPVFSVVTGSERPLPDVELEMGALPAYGLLGEQIPLPFVVRNRLNREVSTEVRLRSPEGEVLATRKIRVPAREVLREALVWAPDRVAEWELELEVPEQEGELLKENNRRAFRLAVRSETLKVLVVDSLPRWEYRFLRNALARDPGVDLHCLLFHPGMGPGGGRFYLGEFPGSKELLSRYDVVFLGDVGIGEGELKAEDAALLRGLVENQASGLVFLPGRRGRHLTLQGTPLGDIYPVILDPEQAGGVGLQNEALLLLTSRGKGHLLTRFDAEEQTNDLIWKNLPGFFWSAAVEKSRPGSLVLAVHSSLRNRFGRLPLLAVRSEGSGKVLFLGTDSAWRWRLGVEDKYHYRFWSQVVRWMAHQRHLSERDGIRLTYSPEKPAVGDTVFLQCTVLDAGGFPAQKGSVWARVQLPSGREERLEFAPAQGGWGVFTSTFEAREAGVHRLDLQAPEQDRRLEAALEVMQPVVEKVGQPVNRGILEELGRITGGAVFEPGQLPALVDRLALLPEPRPREERLRLWSHPLWGAFLLLLLGIYWTVRKIAGMV